MNEIKLTVELSKEDRQRLDVISDTLELIRLALTTAGTPYSAPEPEAKAEPAPEAEPATAPQEAAQQTVTKADTQKKVVELSAAGKKDAVREIVQRYAKKVSDIPEDKLAEVWAQLTALEG